MWGFFLEGYCLVLSLSLCHPIWAYFHVYFMTRGPAPVKVGLDVTSAGFAGYSYSNAPLDALGFSA